MKPNYLTQPPSRGRGRPPKTEAPTIPTVSQQTDPGKPTYQFNTMRFENDYVAVCIIRSAKGEILTTGKGKADNKIMAEENALKNARQKYVDGTERLFQKLMLEG